MKFDLRPLDRTYLEPAFKLATRVFIEASTLHRALAVGLNEYQDYLRPSFEKMVDEGLSFAATDAESGRLMGCLIVSDFCNQIAASFPDNPKFAPMSVLTAELTDQYTQKRSISVGEAILVDMGAVSVDARGQGIYQLMRAAVHDAARNQGFKWVVGELSSSATQHVVLNALGHSKMAEVFFDSFEFEGDYPFRAIEAPPSIILAEGEL
ncbi:MAG: hypothetical protein ACR2O1_04460 [Boseongicola sp.]